MAPAVTTPIQLIHEATVTRQVNWGHGYFVVEFDCPELARTIGVGQFVNVRVRNEFTPLLRRPFSVFDVLTDARGQPTGISLLYHVVGAGTRLMSKYQAGERVNITGPLGLEYPDPPQDHAVVMVGGGIGLAPFLLQSKRWPARERAAGTSREYVLIAGGRSERDLRYLKLFEPAVKQGLNLLVSTDDGSLGIKGRVTVPLRAELEARAKSGKPCFVYCCGPDPMMHAVADLCAEFKVPGISSLESVMACGYGVCNGCVCKVKDAGSPDGSGFKYVKTCLKGPAFDMAQLVWS